MKNDINCLSDFLNDEVSLFKKIGAYFTVWFKVNIH